MRDDPLSIGDRIRKRQRELDLSQRDLSQPAISYAYISRIESGQRRPSRKTLPKLAPELETTAHSLDSRPARPTPLTNSPRSSSSTSPGRFLVERRNWHAKRSEKARARVARKSPPRNISARGDGRLDAASALGVCSAGRCVGCVGRQRQDRRV
jgi:transcriptional regulator with XRE-family HTH domain